MIFLRYRPIQKQEYYVLIKYICKKKKILLLMGFAQRNKYDTSLLVYVYYEMSQLISTGSNIR